MFDWYHLHAGGTFGAFAEQQTEGLDSYSCEVENGRQFKSKARLQNLDLGYICYGFDSEDKPYSTFT